MTSSSVSCRRHRAARAQVSLVVALFATGLCVTATSPPASSQAPGELEVAAQGAGASEGAAELSLTTETGTVTEEVLSGFSLSVSPWAAAGAPAAVVTATVQVGSVSAADLVVAALGDTAYKSALMTTRNLATNVSYALGEPSVTAQLLQAGASGELVQVVLAAKSFQVILPPANANLIVNGNFSKPAQVSVPYYETVYASAQKLSTGLPAFPGWTVGPDSVDVMGARYWAPPAGLSHGSQSVDLSGADPGSITQAVGTTAGSSYLLKWYAAANPECGQVTRVMHVLWDHALVVSLTINTGDHTDHDMGWSPESQVVTASSTQSELEFKDATGGDSPCGPAVAGVSLTAEQS